MSKRDSHKGEKCRVVVRIQHLLCEHAGHMCMPFPYSASKHLSVWRIISTLIEITAASVPFHTATEHYFLVLCLLFGWFRTSVLASRNHLHNLARKYQEACRKGQTPEAKYH